MPMSGEFHPTLRTARPGRQSQRYGLCLEVLLWTSRKIINIYDRNRPCSIVGIATGYGLDGPGIESRWELDFPHMSRAALWPNPASCIVGAGSFPGVKSGRGVTLNPHPFLVPLVMKE